MPAKNNDNSKVPYSRCHVDNAVRDSANDRRPGKSGAMTDTEGSPNTQKVHGEHQHRTSEWLGNGKNNPELRTEEPGTSISQNPAQPRYKPSPTYPPRKALYHEGKPDRPFSSEEEAQHGYKRHHDANAHLQKLQAENTRLEMDCEALQWSSKERETDVANERNKLLQKIEQLKVSLIEEQCKTWAQKKKLDHSNDRVEEQRRGFLDQKESFQAALNESRNQATREREQHNRELKKMQSKLNELEAEHIQSINRIGTGLEPIATHTFEDRFRALHDEVNWPHK
jgi:hypothetical protein